MSFSGIIYLLTIPHSVAEYFCFLVQIPIVITLYIHEFMPYARIQHIEYSCSSGAVSRQANLLSEGKVT